MAQPKPTIIDVAARARVSVGTVSHVLTGSIPVSERLRARVMQAVEGLGYVPNFHAQGLRGKRSWVIGVCFPHISITYPSLLSSEIEQLAARDGYNILHVFSRQNPETEMRRIKELLGYRIDGLILFPISAHHEPLDLLADKGVPTVLIDRPLEEKRFDHVIVNNVQGMQKAVELLTTEYGHTNILFICRTLAAMVTQSRLEGMEAVKKRLKGKLTTQVIEYGDDEQGMRDKITKMFLDPRPPTAIITSNSHLAAVVTGHVKDLGVSCPEQVSLLTFDDPEWAGLVTPRLSVIRQPAVAIARQAWDMLMDRMKNKRAKPKMLALEADIEIRDSVGPRPGFAPARAPTATGQKKTSISV